MTVGDLIFYVLDAIVLFLLVRMLRDSRKVEIETRLGPRWVIPCVFWAIAAVSNFNYTGSFRLIQTIILVVMGIMYWFMRSGLAPEGVVMIGRLYKYEKCMPMEVDDEFEAVRLTIRKAPTEIRFPGADMKAIRKYLSDHAGIPIKNVRRKH